VARDGALCSEQAWAKVNLTLQVIGRRGDGYHELESLVVFADVGDRLLLENSDALTLKVEGPFAAALAGAGDNLVLRAAGALAARAGGPVGAAMTLIKNLPVASGIGAVSRASGVSICRRRSWKPWLSRSAPTCRSACVAGPR
jgi:4-diphosphocytidyl-2-C-methyl-D-erythritol kinase